MCGQNILPLAAMAAAAYFTGGASLAAEGAGAAAFTGATETGLATVAGEGAATAGGATWLSTATPYLQAGGAAMSAYGAISGADAQKKAEAYNAQVAANNAQVAGWQATDAENRADLNAQDIGRKQAATRGVQAANMAANGLDLSFGSSKATLDQTDTYGLQDQRTALDAGNKEAWALRARAAGFSSESAFSQAKSDASNPLLAGATSLIGSAGNIADSYARRRYSAGEGGSGFFKS